MRPSVIAAAPALAVLVLALGCGGIVKPADESVSPVGSTAPRASASPSPSAPKERCLATMTTKGRRPGWVDAGKLTITTADKKTSSAELRDASGHVVTRPSAPSDAGAFKTWMAESVCAVGGYVLVLDGAAVQAAEKGGKTTLEGVVVRPGKDDEAADLATLCAEPKLALPADAPPLKRFVAATEEYGETLTSKRWRGWLFTTMGYGSFDVAPPPKAHQADELDAAAKQANLGTCWFATMLRERQTHP